VVRSGKAATGDAWNFTIEDDAQGIDGSRGQAVCVEDEVGRLVEALLKYALPWYRTGKEHKCSDIESDIYIPVDKQTQIIVWCNLDGNSNPFRPTWIFMSRLPVSKMWPLSGYTISAIVFLEDDLVY
jgi:hypothetical protein